MSFDVGSMKLSVCRCVWWSFVLRSLLFKFECSTTTLTNRMTGICFAMFWGRCAVFPILGWFLLVGLMVSLARDSLQFSQARNTGVNRMMAELACWKMSQSGGSRLLICFSSFSPSSCFWREVLPWAFISGCWNLMAGCLIMRPCKSTGRSRCQTGCFVDTTTFCIAAITTVNEKAGW